MSNGTDNARAHAPESATTPRAAYMALATALTTWTEAQAAEHGEQPVLTITLAPLPDDGTETECGLGEQATAQLVSLLLADTPGPRRAKKGTAFPVLLHAVDDWREDNTLPEDHTARRVLRITVSTFDNRHALSTLVGRHAERLAQLLDKARA